MVFIVCIFLLIHSYKNVDGLSHKENDLLDTLGQTIDVSTTSYESDTLSFEPYTGCRNAGNSELKDHLFGNIATAYFLVNEITLRDGNGYKTETRTVSSTRKDLEATTMADLSTYNNTKQEQKFNKHTKAFITEHLETNTVEVVHTESVNMIYKEVYTKATLTRDTYLVPVLCPVGIFGNSLIAYILFSKRRLNSSFIYMFALLVVDIAGLLTDLTLPVVSLLETVDSEDLLEASAWVYFVSVNIVSYIIRGTGLNILCVLSTERLIAIKYPFHLKSSWTVQYYNVFLLASFIVGFISYLPRILFSKIVSKVNPVTNKTIYDRGYTELYIKNKVLCDNLVIFVGIIDGLIPILFIFIMSSLIIRELSKIRRRSILSLSDNRLKRTRQNQIRLCKVFLVLCFMYAAAFLPNSLVQILAKLFPQLNLNFVSYQTKLILETGYFLMVINSMSDFIVILMMSGQVRRDVKAIFIGQQQGGPT